LCIPTAYRERGRRTITHSRPTGDIGLAIFPWDCLRERAAFPTPDVFFGEAPR